MRENPYPCDSWGAAICSELYVVGRLYQVCILQISFVVGVNQVLISLLHW